MKMKSDAAAAGAGSFSFEEAAKKAAEGKDEAPANDDELY